VANKIISVYLGFSATGNYVVLSVYGTSLRILSDCFEIPFYSSPDTRGEENCENLVTGGERNKKNSSRSVRVYSR